jgi:hypothetical protein
VGVCYPFSPPSHKATAGSGSFEARESQAARGGRESKTVNVTASLSLLFGRGRGDVKKSKSPHGSRFGFDPQYPYGMIPKDLTGKPEFLEYGVFPLSPHLICPVLK